MIDFIFGAFGAFLRLIFVYTGDSNKMGQAYNENPVVEGGKNNAWGFIIIPLAILVGWLIC